MFTQFIILRCSANDPCILTKDAVYTFEIDIDFNWAYHFWLIEEMTWKNRIDFICLGGIYALTNQSEFISGWCYIHQV